MLPERGSWSDLFHGGASAVGIGVSIRGSLTRRDLAVFVAFYLDRGLQLKPALILEDFDRIVNELGLDGERGNVVLRQIGQARGRAGRKPLVEDTERVNLHLSGRSIRSFNAIGEEQAEVQHNICQLRRPYKACEYAGNGCRIHAWAKREHDEE